MSKASPEELESIIENMRAQLAVLSERLAHLEKSEAPASGSNGAPKAAVAPAKPEAVPEPEPKQTITEEELLAISAAIAAVFGVRTHIRQIRLITSPVWAQEGRVSIQASHRLHS